MRACALEHRNTIILSLAWLQLEITVSNTCPGQWDLQILQLNSEAAAGAHGLEFQLRLNDFVGFVKEDAQPAVQPAKLQTWLKLAPAEARVETVIVGHRVQWLDKKQAGAHVGNQRNIET